MYIICTCVRLCVCACVRAYLRVCVLYLDNCMRLNMRVNIAHGLKSALQTVDVLL